MCAWAFEARLDALPRQWPEWAELSGLGACEGPRRGWTGGPDTQPLTVHLLPFAVARRPAPRPRAKSAGAGSETAREGPRGSDPWPTQPVGQRPARTPGGGGPPSKRLCPGFPHVLGSVNKADGLPSQVCAGSRTGGSGGHGLEERLSGPAREERSAGRGPKGAPFGGQGTWFHGNWDAPPGSASGFHGCPAPDPQGPLTLRSAPQPRSSPPESGPSAPECAPLPRQKGFALECGGRSRVQNKGAHTACGASRPQRKGAGKHVSGGRLGRHRPLCLYCKRAQCPAV